MQPSKRRWSGWKSSSSAPMASTPTWRWRCSRPTTGTRSEPFPSRAPPVARAHPVGTFTRTHYARIEPAGARVRLVYVLDMAEIPTFQEKPRLDASMDRYADERAEDIRQHLTLTLGGQPAALRLE